MNTETALEILDAMCAQSEKETRIRRARDYLMQNRHARRDSRLWWDAVVRRALLCGGVAVAVAVLLALVVTV